MRWNGQELHLSLKDDSKVPIDHPYNGVIELGSTNLSKRVVCGWGQALFGGMRHKKARHNIFWGTPKPNKKRYSQIWPRQMIHRKQVGGISCLAEEWLGRGLEEGDGRST